MERLAEMFVLPLGTSFALDGATPLEGAIARCRDKNSSGIVAATAAQEIASVNSLRCFIARPASSSNRTCYNATMKHVRFPITDTTRQLR